MSETEPTTSNSGRTMIEFGGFSLDTRQALLTKNGKPIRISPKALEILTYLAMRPNEVVKKDDLIRSVWPDSFVEEANLAVHISALRKILANGGETGVTIETFPKVGYRLTAKVQTINSSSRAAGMTGTGETNDVQPIPGSEDRPVQAVRSRAGLWLAAAVAILAITVSAILLWSRSSRDVPRELSMTPVAGGEGVTAAAFSANGEYAAFVKRIGTQQSLSTVHIASGSSVTMLADKDLGISSLTFSRNGNQLYFTKGSGASAGLYKIPLLGGNAVKIIDAVGSRISFSPDGSQFCYVKTAVPNLTSLIIANEDGSGERELARRVSPEYFATSTLAWSPDGKVIAIAIGSPERNPKMQLAGFDVLTAEERLVSSGKWAGTDGAEWLSDGTGMIAATFEGPTSPTQLLYFPLDGGEPTKITKDLNNYGLVGLSSDGRSLLAVEHSEDTSVWIAEPGANAVAFPAKADQRHRFHWVRWASDGGMLFGSDAGDRRDVWRINLDGTGERQLTFGPDANVMPSMTADGRFIVFAGYRKGDGFFDLYRMNADGSGQVQLTTTGGAYQPSLSPDAKWVYYTAGKMGGPLDLRRVWRVPVEGGKPEQFLDIPAYYPDVSPDGRFIALWIKPDEASRPKVAIVLAETAKIQRILEGPEGDRLDWTPDRKGISFIRTVDGVSNIWTQLLDGGEPRQETRFTSETIRNFEWSADGRLLCSRLRNRRQAILMRNFR